MNQQLTRMDTHQALEHYGINFDVVKAPCLTIIDGQMKEVPNVNSVVRTDTNEVIPGVSVSDTYGIVQTRDYTDIIEKVTNELQADFTKGGVLRSGKLTYLQCKLPDSIRVKGTNDIVDKYLTFINSFDGSSRFLILPTAIRLWCQNQMAALTREAKTQGLKFVHSSGVHDRLQFADQAILDVMDAYRTFEVKLDWLADTKFNDAQMELAVSKMFGVDKYESAEEIPTRTKNNMQQVRELFETGVGLEGWRGTAYAAFNSFTEYSDHHRSLRKTTDKFDNRLLGTGATFKRRALDVIEEVLAA